MRLPNRLSTAIAAWQDDVGGLGLEGGDDDLAQRADSVIAGLDAKVD